MPKQQDLLSESPFQKRSDSFGGGHRTTRLSRRYRPVATKASMHLILKSLNAYGNLSLLTPRNVRIVNRLLAKHSESNGVKIIRYVNVGNHLHLHLKVKSVHLYKRFIRALTGAIAQQVTGASKTQKLKARFWTHVPFTRFLHGINDIKGLNNYFDINCIEAGGFGRATAKGFIDAILQFRRDFFTSMDLSMAL